MSKAEWTLGRLGNYLTEIEPGYASGAHNTDGNGIPHLRPMNVSTDGRIDRSVVKYVQPQPSREAKRLRHGDVLFNNTNSPELVGKTALFEGDDGPAFSNHMTRLRTDSDRLLPGYLALRLHHAWRTGWFQAHCNNHVSQASIGREVLEAFEFEVPDVEVQRAIVSVVSMADDLRSSAAQHLIGATKAAQRLVTTIRSAACSGRLTADWRESQANPGTAASIVDSIEAYRRQRLGKKYKPANMPETTDTPPDGWCLTTVGALVDVATGATPLRQRNDYYNGTVAWVTSGAVNAGYISESTEYITELALRETNAKVFQPGTLLVAMYGEGQTRGRVAELGIPAATNQAVAALLFDEQTEALRPYLRLFFEHNYEQIRTLSFGGVQPNLSLGVIRDTVIPLPPADEQAEIIRRTRHLLDTAHKLIDNVAVASRQVRRSAQALPAKAFRGEITTASNDS